MIMLARQVNRLILKHATAVVLLWLAPMVWAASQHSCNDVKVREPEPIHVPVEPDPTKQFHQASKQKHAKSKVKPHEFVIQMNEKVRTEDDINTDKILGLSHALHKCKRKDTKELCACWGVGSQWRRPRVEPQVETDDMPEMPVYNMNECSMETDSLCSRISSYCSSCFAKSPVTVRTSWYFAGQEDGMLQFYVDYPDSSSSSHSDFKNRKFYVEEVESVEHETQLKLVLRVKKTNLNKSCWQKCWPTSGTKSLKVELTFDPDEPQIRIQDNVRFLNLLYRSYQCDNTLYTIDPSLLDDIETILTEQLGLNPDLYTSKSNLNYETDWCELPPKIITDGVKLRIKRRSGNPESNITEIIEINEVSQMSRVGWKEPTGSDGKFSVVLPDEKNNGILYSDCQQSLEVGDCYFMSQLASLANVHPERIYPSADWLEKNDDEVTRIPNCNDEPILQPAGDGKWRVTLWRKGTQCVQVIVDSYFPDFMFNRDPENPNYIFAGRRLYWPFLIEKAYSYFHAVSYKKDPEKDATVKELPEYESIKLSSLKNELYRSIGSGGFTNVAFNELTNMPGNGFGYVSTPKRHFDTGGMQPDDLEKLLDNTNVLTFNYKEHTYAILKVDVERGYVELFDPNHDVNSLSDMKWIEISKSGTLWWPLYAEGNGFLESKVSVYVGYYDLNWKRLVQPIPLKRNTDTTYEDNYFELSSKEHLDAANVKVCLFQESTRWKDTTDGTFRNHEFPYHVGIHRSPKDLLKNTPYSRWREGTSEGLYMHCCAHSRHGFRDVSMFASNENTTFSGADPYWVRVKTTSCTKRGPKPRGFLNLVVYYRTDSAECPITIQETSKPKHVFPDWKGILARKQEITGWNPRLGQWCPCQIVEKRGEYMCGEIYDVQWMLNDENIETDDSDLEIPNDYEIPARYLLPFSITLLRDIPEFSRTIHYDGGDRSLTLPEGDWSTSGTVSQTDGRFI